jgi:DNA repair exonuclease SbcCD ATPase subunit/DNA repair exonuclease SbcCD nuclease subunit
LKIAHISDVHIRNYRYHKEYQQVFENLYKKLEEIKPDIIVNTGDTAHTKLNLSPSYFDMTAKMSKRLGDIAPYHIILGNHDLNLRNLSRVDAITPVVEALNHPNIFLHKNTAQVDVGHNCVLNVLSIIDPENWEPPISENKINIALYHGCVSGVTTDTGFVLSHGDISLSELMGYDYVLLGDIHKTNQKVDKKGKMRYPGSLIQQNFGESEDKGFLLWDIKSKEEFTCEHYALENPKPFVTLELTRQGQLPKNLNLQPGARLRLVSENALSLEVIRRSIEIVKTKFKPESVTYICRSKGSQGTANEIIEGLENDDLRDLEVQEELIDEYLSEYQVDQDTLQTVLHLNHKYNAIAEEEEEVRRNINWSLRSFKWDNLFNYGEDNYIDFEKTNGVVGILGKNFSGKSSIIDSLLYTLFNSTSKNERKNLNIMNQNKEEASATVELAVGHSVYRIERESKKYERTLKGNTTQEAKTDVEFIRTDQDTGEEVVLTGDKRSSTDKNIRSIFGTLDDFLLTSMASQLGSLNYINEGSTKRKEILAKFLDLEIFEKKFKKAKDDASDLKSALKRFNGKDFEKELKDLRTELARNETSIEHKERICDEIESEVASLESKKKEIEDSLASIPEEIIDINQVLKEIRANTKILEDTLEKNKENKRLLSEKQETNSKIEQFVDEFPLDNIQDARNKISNNEEKISELDKELDILLLKLKQQEKKTTLLDEVPCGDEYSHCKFIKDAYRASEVCETTKKSVEDLKISRNKVQRELDQLGVTKVEQRYEKYLKILEKKNVISNEISSMLLSLEKNKTLTIKTQNVIDLLKEKKSVYNENKEAIENYETLEKEFKNICKQILLKTETHECCKKERLEFYKLNGSLEQKLLQLETEEEEKGLMQKQFSAYHLLMTCMHSNGISYDIIKKKLPVINEEVSKILTNIVTFEAMFVSDDKKLDILIKHPGYDPRPIEMGSGAEKTLVAMAIRLALLNVTTMPKGDIFILDEPGTALDEENMEGFVRMLEMIKSQFKTVLLISHLDALKDIVDKQIIIEKENGFAKVYEG